MKKTIVVDIDGVLADFEGAFCEQFGYDHRDKERLDERYPRNTLAISQFLGDPQVYENLKPIELGMQVVDYLNDRGDMWVTIVTARPLIFQTLTKRWLKQNGVRYNSISFGSHKTSRISLMKPVCAIDDLLSMFDGLIMLNVPVLVQAQPWNDTYRTDVVRFGDLRGFIRQFEEILG